MKILDDGVIKYDNSDFKLGEPPKPDEYGPVEYWRKKLFLLKMIGEEEISGVGYGNLSKRVDYSGEFSTKNPQFVITGTQTGKHPDLDAAHYTKVLDFNINNYSLKASGAIHASSEAITHAAIYEINPKINFIFHVHHKDLWQFLLDNDYPKTNKDTPYGTPEMAREMSTLINSVNGLFAMEGHEDGIISYSENETLAGEQILKIYDKLNG